MAVFEASYVTSHIYSVSKTRARGWRSGPGGWARVPHCSCGWNNPAVHKGDRFWWTSPNGSMFPDHYPTDEIAMQVWAKEHVDVALLAVDRGQLLLVLTAA